MREKERKKWEMGKQMNREKQRESNIKDLGDERKREHVVEVWNQDYIDWGDVHASNLNNGVMIEISYPLKWMINPFRMDDQSF